MTDRDNITLPREVVQEAVEAFEAVRPFSTTQRELKIRAVEALRTALAAEPTKPSDDRKAMKEALRILTKPESGDLRWQVSDACDILRTAIRTALAAPKQEHPGYVIGSHWLETAYSRICAGEAEADVLRDCGWERVDQALRRDAERYRLLRRGQRWSVINGIGDALRAEELDAAIDAAMGDKT